MYVDHMHAGDTQRSENDVRSPGTGVINGFELFSVSWEMNPYPLKDQQVLLIPESYF